MKSLSHNEMKENSFIMIDLKDEASSLAYFILKISIGVITGGTMLLGATVNKFANNPKYYEKATNGNMECYYISSDKKPKGGDREVLRYRTPNPKEKEDIQKKLEASNNDNLKDLIKYLH